MRRLKDCNRQENLDKETTTTSHRTMTGRTKDTRYRLKSIETFILDLIA